MAESDELPELEESSVPVTIILTLATLYLYYPFWFIMRRKALNRLHTSENVGLAMLKPGVQNKNANKTIALHKKLDVFFMFRPSLRFVANLKSNFHYFGLS